MYTDIMVVHCPNVSTLHFRFDVYKFSCQPVVFLSVLIYSLLNYVSSLKEKKEGSDR
jgi:hypothetical protein